MPQHRNMEVYEQANRQPGEAKVSEHLGFVYREEAFDRFDLENQEILDDKVQTISAVEVETFVLQRQSELALNVVSPQPQLMGETVLVSGFE